MLLGSAGYRRFDSLAVDADGWVWVATLVEGAITVVRPDGTVAASLPTGDPMTTNICLDPAGTGGWATLSGTGRLIRMDWAPEEVGKA